MINIKENKTLGNVIKVSNLIFFMTMLAALALCIYLLTQLPIENTSFKGLGKTMGSIGMIISFFPLGGLVFKYLTKILDKYEQSKSVLIINTSLKVFLYWERKTRLLMAWTAIFLITAHMIVLASMIDSHAQVGKHASKYSWSFAIIIGVVALSLLILMNLNGIIMLIMRKNNYKLDKIKYLGMFNLVCGIAFLVFTIIHISMVG